MDTLTVTLDATGTGLPNEDPKTPTVMGKDVVYQTELTLSPDLKAPPIPDIAPAFGGPAEEGLITEPSPIEQAAADAEE